MATTTPSRFIKVDGSFERPGLTQEQFDENLRNFNAANPGQGRTLNLPASGALQGATSNTPGSSLPAAPAPEATPTAPSGQPIDNFNLLLTGLLKGAQGVTTTDFLARKRALERASLGKTAEITPEDMRTLSPSQQNSIRSGNVDALKPEIDANAYELKKAEDSIDNFFKVHTAAAKIGKDFADNMVAPDSVIENAKAVIEADPAKLSGILAGFNDKSKQKIIGSLDYSKMKPTSGTGSNNQTIDNESALRNQFTTNPIVKDYNTIVAKKLTVDSIVNGAVGGPEDLAVVYEFMKGLDPSSVVRESEFDTAAKSGNIFSGVLAKFNGYLKPNGGFLPENVKKEFQNIVNKKLETQTKLYDNFREEQRAIAKRQQLNPDNVAPNFSAVNQPAPAATTGQTSNGLKYTVQ